ncbi:MAG: hypothetical protein F6K55_12985 [Moorea sp. SIO4A3]|nr:hypothetical protein [Moorena sp. SIO4A3]
MATLREQPSTFNLPYTKHQGRTSCYFHNSTDSLHNSAENLHNSAAVFTIQP